MGIAGYRSILALRDVRRVLWLSIVVRVPMWAGNVVLTLHVVTHLHRSYSDAGLVVGVATVALAISAPWRGRRLDQVGLRAAVAPSLVVLAVCWSIAPFVPLLAAGRARRDRRAVRHPVVLDRAAGAHARRPRRDAQDGAVDRLGRHRDLVHDRPGARRAARHRPGARRGRCSAASSTSVARRRSCCGSMNPPIGRSDARADGATPACGRGCRRRASPCSAPASPRRSCSPAPTSSIVAALRHMHHAVAGSASCSPSGGSARRIGGVVYGAMSRTRVRVRAARPARRRSRSRPRWPASRSRSPRCWSLAGVCCAPTITATVDSLSRVVPGTGPRRGAWAGTRPRSPPGRRSARRSPASRSTTPAGRAASWLPAIVGLAVAAARAGRDTPPARAPATASEPARRCRMLSVS